MIGCISLLIALGAAASQENLKMSAWVILDDDGSSVKDYKAHARNLQSVSFAWIGCDSKGVVKRHPLPATVNRQDLLKIAKQNHVTAYAMVVNDGFSPAGIELTLKSPETIQAHADQLVKIAIEDGFNGIDLDYESLNATDRDSFSRLVVKIGEVCHAHNLKLAIALHSKESEPGNWDGAIAQDYAAIGKAVDSVRVMTYDDHWETSEAGPIAPPDWVERVMAFAASQIPAKKLEMGIPGYGYDWLAKKARGIGWGEWCALLEKNGNASRDSQSQELTLKYEGRIVFFADGEAVRQKFSIARKIGINGFALWRMGSEDPAFWSLYSKLSE